MMRSPMLLIAATQCASNEFVRWLEAYNSEPT